MMYPIALRKSLDIKPPRKSRLTLYLLMMALHMLLMTAFTPGIYIFIIWIDLKKRRWTRFLQVLYAILKHAFKMEERGVCVDVEHLETMRTEINEDIDSLLYQMYDLAGVKFNPGSSQQLGELLFNYVPEKKLDKEPTYTSLLLENTFGLRPISKTASGAPQTNADALYKLSKMSYKRQYKRKQQGVELCKLLMDYKKLSKLKSAFIDGLLNSYMMMEKHIPLLISLVQTVDVFPVLTLIYNSYLRLMKKTNIRLEACLLVVNISQMKMEIIFVTLKMLLMSKLKCMR